MNGRGIAAGAVALAVLWSIAQGGDDSTPRDPKSSQPSAAATASGADQIDPAPTPTPTPAAAAAVVTMEDLTGLTRAEARSWSRSAGITLGEVKRRWSPEPDGTVLAQSITAGTSTGARAVDITVSRQMARVPLLVDRQQSGAVAALRQTGLRVVVTTITRSSGRDGVVLRQSRSRGTFLRPGTVVRLTVLDVVRPAPASCTSGYSPCLSPASDYDCAGGSGDGPGYASGPIYVTGSDPYDLDYDGDGVACE